MKRYESKTNSGIIAAIIVLICFIFIVVVTYFLLKHYSKPNDGSLGVNITTGKVDVDIVDDKDVSLVGDVLDFETKDPEQQQVYFEPGATYYTQGFAVQNKGNILIKYRIYISDDQNVDRAALDKAFEFYITTDVTGQTGQNLQEFSGTLAGSEKSVTYYLVVKMKTTAGNEFQDKTYAGIGITVYATQASATDD